MNRTFNAALAVILLCVIIQSSGCLTKTSGDKAGPVNIIPRPVEIQDWPRFGWRGLMLDCSRTFQSLDYIRKTIDREPELVDRQLFPRLLSIAERGWSPAEVQDRDDFMSRLEKHLPLLEKMDITYYREQK